MQQHTDEPVCWTNGIATELFHKLEQLMIIRLYNRSIRASRTRPDNPCSFSAARSVLRVILTDAILSRHPLTSRLEAYRAHFTSQRDSVIWKVSRRKNKVYQTCSESQIWICTAASALALTRSIGLVVSAAACLGTGWVESGIWNLESDLTSSSWYGLREGKICFEKIVGRDLVKTIISRDGNSYAHAVLAVTTISDTPTSTWQRGRCSSHPSGTDLTIMPP